MKRFILCLPAVVLLGSCLLFKDPHQGFHKSNARASAVIVRGSRYDSSTFFRSFYDATKRSTLTYFTDNGKPIILAENNPDVGINEALTFLAKVHTGAGLDVAAGAHISNAIVKLTEKTPGNIFTRDALYRLNEMYLNTLFIYSDAGRNIDVGFLKQQALDSATYRSIFNAIIDAARQMSDNNVKIMEYEYRKAELAYMQANYTDSIARLSEALRQLKDSNLVLKDSL